MSRKLSRRLELCKRFFIISSGFSKKQYSYIILYKRLCRYGMIDASLFWLKCCTCFIWRRTHLFFFFKNQENVVNICLKKDLGLRSRLTFSCTRVLFKSSSACKLLVRHFGIQKCCNSRYCTRGAACNVCSMRVEPRAATGFNVETKGESDWAGS